jgi:hypothetical protein
MTEQYYRAWEISLSIPAPTSFADTSNWTEEQTLKKK